MINIILLTELSNGRKQAPSRETIPFIKMASEILTFILGCLVGWFTNHWYSVLMKRPSLILSGGGGSSNFLGSGFHSTNLTIQNELRKLGISLPETVILGKQLRTDFGGQIVERETACQCRAQLLETSGKYICHLW